MSSISQSFFRQEFSLEKNEFYAAFDITFHNTAEVALKIILTKQQDGTIFSETDKKDLSGPLLKKAFPPEQVQQGIIATFIPLTYTLSQAYLEKASQQYRNFGLTEEQITQQMIPKMKSQAENAFGIEALSLD